MQSLLCICRRRRPKQYLCAPTPALTPPCVFVLSLLTERLALEDLGPALGDDGARRRGRRDEPRGLQRLALNHI